MLETFEKSIQLMYQVRAREQQNVEDYFSQLKNKIASTPILLENAREIEYSEIETIYQPVHPEQINLAREKGFLVTDYYGSACLVIRVLPIKIRLQPSDNARGFLTMIHAHCGDIFAIVRVVTDYLTEVGPE